MCLLLFLFQLWELDLEAFSMVCYCLYGCCGTSSFQLALLADVGPCHYAPEGKTGYGAGGVGQVSGFSLYYYRYKEYITYYILHITYHILPIDCLLIAY